MLRRLIWTLVFALIVFIALAMVFLPAQPGDGSWPWPPGTWWRWW